ncbi:hypothetical protein [Pelagibius sp. Alg239-R121]|uniref:DUF7674 family protein n=1 Tax=Pelagibius sp. Alg239-R121 TaxID=2993448 RepID=UPI0024A6AB76|nr:hypothetical protein [Pelagibius sp. Alg239-R121]
MNKWVPRWRHLAKALLPELYDKERPETLYFLFFDLNPLADKALKSGDTDQLARIYAFTEWCFCHKERYIWNAAGVGFYENLFDRDADVDQVVSWLSRSTYDGVKGLFEWRLESAKAKEIDLAMNARSNSYEELIQMTLAMHLDQMRRDFKRKAS